MRSLLAAWGRELWERPIATVACTLMLATGGVRAYHGDSQGSEIALILVFLMGRKS
jgi:hypothetical protein